MKIKKLAELEVIKGKGMKLIYPDKLKISVGMATCGLATGAQEVYDEIENSIQENKLDAILTKTGCLGFCQKEPLVDVYVPGSPRLTYCEMTSDKARELMISIRNKEFRDEYLLCKFEEEFLLDESIKKYGSNGNLNGISSYQEVPFFAKQKKIALRNCGFINPDSIEEYIARGGYRSLYKVLSELSPEQTIEEVKKSGLRGRGGAGFPTGRKWEFARKEKSNIKYIVCNADEGDPGAYMDRSVLEGDPHSVLEGMLIGAYAIGVSKGFVYVRSEYPLAIVRLKRAFSQAREYGVLGENIFDTGFNFDVEIREGSGAFVCGEETSLIHSIEGVLPEPRQRPPFPAQSGLWGKPTNINNVETWANIPAIIAKGSNWYSKIGTEKSKGTKVFSLVGKVVNTGLVEVPMGITLREIIYDIGGGIPDNKRFKAVQTGGPSGGCIPANLVDLPIDYEELAEVGSMMGSGGMVVMDEDTCVVDIAKYFLTFTNDESCGKCTSCREGSQAMLEVLTRISEGKGKKGDIDFLEELGEAVKDGSQCGLGQTLPNPVLSTLQHFSEEYEAHIKYKECPAVVCKKIISSPCQYVCPLNQDVPAYIGYIARGQFEEAINIIRKENPLPLVCGRVCHHPCETKCRSGDGGDPIAIRALKRFAADYELKKGIKPITSQKLIYEEKVAIIGSGPAGLTCGYYLAKEGYEITIFESLPVVGGMLAVGIPEYRLPREILNKEIDIIKEAGVTIKTDTQVENLDYLREQGYKSIFIATGAHKGFKMNIPGEDAEGVMDAVEFLRAINLGEEVKIGERVAVIGGGNAAVDAARTAHRMGYEKVQIIYRRTRAEMPADVEEIEGAIEEGIDIRFLAAPIRVICSNGKLEGIECIRMKLGDFDETGRRRPIPIKGSEFTVNLDAMIYAIRQEPDLSFLKGNKKIQISKWNTIVTNSATFTTDEEGVFAGGDVVTGPATVTEAMGAGKIAAQSIHKYLRGKPVEKEYKVTKPAVYVEPLKLSDAEMEELLESKSPKMPSLSVSERARNFKEVHLGLNEEEAIIEAKRCLRCDLESKPKTEEG
ncbi:MAG: FAD-dependent oxidoreductase [bacterium]